MLFRRCLSILGVPLLVVVAAPVAAQVDCALQIGTIQPPRLSDLRYDIFAREPVNGIGRVDVRRIADPATDGQPCAFVLTLLSEASGPDRLLRAATDELTYVVFDNDADRRVGANVDAVLEPTAFRAVMPAGVDEVTVEFLVEVPPGQLARSGAYDGTITLTLYDDVTDLLEDRQSFSLGVDVYRQADVSVSTTSPAFNLARTFETVDFGTLESGEIQNAFVTVRTTDNFAITLESENNWRLAHVGGVDLGTIDYSVSINGNRVGLAPGEVEAAAGLGPTGGAGRAFDVAFQIGNVDRRRAGRYEDLVTVTVVPQE